MSYSLDGVSGNLKATITAVDTGSWTIGFWIKPSNAGETNSARIVSVQSGTSLRQQVRFLASTMTLRAIQSRATTDATTDTTTTLTASVWSLVISTFRSTDNLCRIYIGDFDTAIAEASYAAQSAGTGARATAGTVCYLGNNHTDNATVDGLIGPTFFDAREWATDEMNAFRLGIRPWKFINLRGLWSLEGDAQDISGNNADLVVTSATLNTGSPSVPYEWQKRPIVKHNITMLGALR